MENIIRKIKQIYPVSDEALQALQANMELRYYPKDTRIVQSGVTDVWFILLKRVSPVPIPPQRRGHHYVVQSGGATLRSAWIRSTISNHR